MKKLNLFAISIIAMLVAVTGVRADVTGVCEVAGEKTFKDCVNDQYARIIKITTEVAVNDSDLKVNDKRVILDSSNAKLIVNGTLSFEGFTTRADDNDAYIDKDKPGYGKSANILIADGAELIVNGTLNITKTYGASALDGNAAGIAVDDITKMTNKVTVNRNAKLVVKGFERAGIVVATMEVNGSVEVADNGNGFNVNKVTVATGAEVNAHDNHSHGLTIAELTATGGNITTKNNGLYGLETNEASLTDTTLVAEGNCTDSENGKCANGNVDIGIEKGSKTGIFTLAGKTSLTAGKIVGKGTNEKVVANGTELTLNIGKCTAGFTGPTKATGIVRAGNWVNVYTLDENVDTIVIGYEDSLGDGIVGIRNFTNKKVYVTTPDSTVKNEVDKAGKDGKTEKVFHLYKVYAGKLNDKQLVEKVSEEEYVVVFADQKFVDLSKAGKTKLDTLLAKEGQHIGEYHIVNGQRLTDEYEFDANNTTIYATYYIILSIGNYEFWVNPNTRLADLNEADKARLEAIKTASDKKFMYFAVDGKAISETDTKFVKDTTLLVLYEGDAAPVVPETEENDPKPPVPGSDQKPSGEQTGNEQTGNEQQGEETQKPNVDNSPTLDNVTSVAAMGGISLAVAAAGIVTLKKREN